MKIIKLESVDSTNEYLKAHNFGEDTAVIAKRQTGGRGTKGRSFSSQDGGLYISVMKYYADFPAGSAFSVMVNACVAVCKTLQKLGLTPVIRWANDVLVRGKKISGTLIENTFSRGKITRSIVGIGVNVNNALPEELKDIAISVKSVSGREIPVNKVAEILVDELEKGYSVDDYKQFVDWLNTEITVKTESETFTATALDIQADGRLKAERDGKVLLLSSAEVTLRL